jgi:hypothetical protein
MEWGRASEAKRAGEPGTGHGDGGLDRPCVKVDALRQTLGTQGQWATGLLLTRLGPLPRFKVTGEITEASDQSGANADGF